MRRYHKRQCLETIDILLEAHAEVSNFIEKKRTEDAIELLGQCQQGAVGIGNLVEQIENEGIHEVHILEDYCEAVWRLSEDIRTGASVNTFQSEKRFHKMLTDVSDGIKTNIPTQREILFLPYKASMWDSLESVWREMKDDPDVIAYVVPIPYYDKNADGTFRQPHYEGLQFPTDVPVMEFQNYNIEERHPDVIYIHNPYDGANFVTSVHPDYYSSRLKDLTDELVYIPYYVLAEIDPANKAAVKGVEHFITVPGVVNAHKVIVQSENWRKAYIDVMTEHAGEKTRSYWEQKIVAKESPKFERVKNLTAEDRRLPAEWEKLVVKPDGSRKKIIFYNTSVTALLDADDRMLDKIKRVLDFFKENSEEVVLLWRPHPLIEATLTAMRPELYEKYRQIVDEYRSEGFGIYDDTPELYRAIAVSDAYYGDHSSVVQLYQQTGKPIMIQNCYV